jgi:hypothetical protein
MDAMRVVIDQEVDTMIPLALQHAFPDRRLQDGERVRSGARRQHLLVVGAGKDISVNVRIKSSKMNMMSIINDVRRDGPISRLKSPGAAIVVADRRIVYSSDPVQGTTRGKDGSARAIGSILDSGRKPHRSGWMFY